MKKIPLNGLKQASKVLSGKAQQARVLYDQWQARVKELDGPEGKRNYTPVRLAELKTEARTDALRQLRAVQGEMRVTLEPALGQRARWTKSALLREQKFADTPKGLSPSEADRSYVATTELLSATRELSALIRAGRLDDESLLEEIRDAATAGAEALPYLGVLTSEARTRKAGGETFKLEVSQAIKRLDFPELEDAEHAFKEIESAAREVAALESALENPSSDFAQGQAANFVSQRKIDERKAAALEAQKNAKPEEPRQLFPSVPSPFVAAEPEQPSAA